MAKLNEVTIDGEVKELTVQEIKKEILSRLPEITTDETFTNLVNAIITVSQKSSGRRAESKSNVLRNMFVENAKITEDEIWAALKWGKHEVLSACWGFRKKGAPEDFLYISFDTSDRTYNLVGCGPEAPEGYGQKSKKVAAESESSEEDLFE